MNTDTSKLFPACFPDDIYQRIIDDGGGYNTYNEVYRIANNGTINRDAFLSSIQEAYYWGEIERRDDYLAQYQETHDIGIYGTSCYQKYNKVKTTFKLMKKHHDGPILLKGNILPISDLSMFTKDSVSNRKAATSHIDWWVFEDYDPSNDFIMVEEA